MLDIEERWKKKHVSLKSHNRLIACVIQRSLFAYLFTNIIIQSCRNVVGLNVDNLMISIRFCSFTLFRNCFQSLNPACYADNIATKYFHFLQVLKFWSTTSWMLSSSQNLITMRRIIGLIRIWKASRFPDCDLCSERKNAGTLGAETESPNY